MAPLLLASILAAGPTAARLAPPADLDCPRDRLTSYTGRVVSYRRTAEALALALRTDWDTSERVRLAPPDTRRLRLAGAPFEAADWPRIEAAPDRAVAGLRATAWVCDGGDPVRIDFGLGPPSSPE